MLIPYPWQSKQWQRLTTSISQEKLPHALLLSASQGLGPGHFAECMAAALLCAKPDTNLTACGECKFCILFHAGNHPDLNRIEPEETGKLIKVDQIREMIDYIHLTSHYGRNKIAIIEPAEAMNRSAANSLLKTLEEPPLSSLLILVSYNPALLPVTVRSRCQQYTFSPAIDKETKKWLEQQLTDEEIDPDTLLHLSQGAPLQALELVRTDTLTQQKTVIEDLNSARANRADPVQIVQKWQDFGASTVLQWLTLFFYKMSRLKLDTSITEIDGNDLIQPLQGLINELDLAQLVMCYDLALKNYHAAVGPINLNKQGLLEDMIIFWQSLKPTERGNKP